MAELPSSQKPPKVELGKETRREILDALRNIKLQIAKPTYRESTATDVAADVIAGGGSLMGAAKEGLAFQAQKSKAEFKRSIDPLNIVHKLTGGSKLATALSGRLMGRSEKSIRSFANLSERADDESPTPLPSSESPSSQGATPFADQEQVPTLLDQMTKSLALIALRVTDIAGKMGATKNIKLTPEGRLRDTNTGKFVSGDVARSEEQQTEYLKELRDTTFASEREHKEELRLERSKARQEDRQGDVSAEEQYKRKFGKPTRIGETGKPISSLMNKVTGGAQDPNAPKGNFLEQIGGWFKNLSLEALEFGAALALLKRPFTAIKSILTGTFELFTAGIKAVPSVLEKIPGAAKAIGGIGSSLVKGVKGMAGAAAGALGLSAATKGAGATTGALETTGKVLSEGGEVAAKGVTAATPAVKELGAASTMAKGVTGAERVASKSKVLGVLKNIAPKILKSKAASVIPVVGTAMGLYFAAQRLMKGDLVGAGIDAAGALPIPGASIPAIVTSLVRDAYTEVYSPKDGPPLYPEKDPLAPERLPEMMSMGKQVVSDWLTGKADGKSTEDGSPTVAGAASGLSGSTPPGTPSVVPTGAESGMVQVASEGVEPGLTDTLRPSEISTPAPQTGGALLAAKDFQREAAVQQGGGDGGSMTNLTKVNNNTITNTSVFPGMASPRSGESTWLRVTARDYVPT